MTDTNQPLDYIVEDPSAILLNTGGLEELGPSVSDADLFKIFLNQDEVLTEDPLSINSQYDVSPLSSSLTSSPTHLPIGSDSDNGVSPQSSPPLLMLTPDSSSGSEDLMMDHHSSQLLSQQQNEDLMNTNSFLQSDSLSFLPSFGGAENDDLLMQPIKEELVISVLDENGVPRTPASIGSSTSPTSRLANATSNNKTNTSSKKRDRNGNKGESPLALSRDELLRLSSKGLESFASTISSTRQLTPDEERQLKKQRRLIKNRESAQLSRLRKKVYIEELEKKVNSLISETETVTKQLVAVTNDRNKLSQEVIYLRNLLKQNNIATNPSSISHNSQNNGNANNSAIQISSATSSQQQYHNQLSHSVTGHNSMIGSSNKKLLNSRNVKAASVCLMLVLFSFGLLFQSDDLTAKDKHMFAGRALKSVEEAAVKLSTSLTSSSNSAEISAGASDLVPVNVAAMVEEVSEKTPLDTKVNTRKHSRQESATSGLVSGQISEKSQKKKVRISVEDSEEKSSLVPLHKVVHNSGSIPPPVPLTKDQQMLLHNHHLLHNGTSTANITRVVNRPNTSYMYCPEAQHIPAGSAGSGPGQPENIALLIPSSILNSNTGQVDTSLLEVSCQVLSYYIWPMTNNNTAN